MSTAQSLAIQVIALGVLNFLVIAYCILTFDAKAFFILTAFDGCLLCIYAGLAELAGVLEAQQTSKVKTKNN